MPNIAKYHDSSVREVNVGIIHYCLFLFCSLIFMKL